MDSEECTNTHVECMRRIFRESTVYDRVKVKPFLMKPMLPNPELLKQSLNRHISTINEDVHENLGTNNHRNERIETNLETNKWFSLVLYHLDTHTPGYMD